MFELSKIPINITRLFAHRSLAAVLLMLTFTVTGFAQDVSSMEYKSQEVSEVDGIPVLIKHLPDWENKRGSARLARSSTELRALLGVRPVLDVIEFSPGSEAVTAKYEVGTLIILEHPSPQASIETDSRLNAWIQSAGDGRTLNKRIGNYNVFVLDATGGAAANDLIDQVKYEKQITWLGDNPFAISAERAFVITTSQIFLSTTLVIVGGAAFAIFGGTVVGFLFYGSRYRHRARMPTFSDAGGMTRLNLDGFTPDIIPERLLGD